MAWWIVAGIPYVDAWTLVLQYVLGKRKRKALAKGQTKSQSSNRSGPSDPGSRINERHLLQRAYLFAFTMAATTQLATFAILLARTSFPSLLSRTLLVSPSFRKVFIPPMFNNPAKAKNMAIGIHNFFQYDQYVGSAAALLWALTLHRNSLQEPMTLKSWIWLVAEVAGLSFLVGPGGALVSLIWNRDSRLIGEHLYPKYRHYP